MRTAPVGQIFVIENHKLDYDRATQANRQVLEELDPPGGKNWCGCDWVQAYKEFRKYFTDDYDFFAMIPDDGMSQPQPHHLHVFNNVVGINYDYGNYFDIRRCFDSTRLQGIAALAQGLVTRFERLHELAHRWGAYVLFKRSPSDQTDHDDLINTDHHWSSNFNADFSSVVGKSGANWTDNRNGTFLKTIYDQSDPRVRYCSLDLYLMGMLTPDEVGTFFYVDNLKGVKPGDLIHYTGRRNDLEVRNIEWAHGRRQPNAAHSQRTFRLACVVLTKNLAQGKRLAHNLQQARIDFGNEFRKFTDSRGLVDTHLYNSSYDGIYIKHHALDTGIEPMNGVFWNSPDIWVRHAKNGNNWAYVRVRNNGTKPSGEVTVNLFQSDRSGTEFLYPQDWRWEKQHHIDDSKTIGSVPAGGKKTLRFKWDHTKVATAAKNHLCLLAEILPSHPTLTKLRYVWQDRRIAQKNLTILSPTRGRNDIKFPFTIGAHTLPQRSVRIRVEQKGGSSLGEISLDLGEKYEADKEAKPWGGSVVKRNGHFVFVIGIGNDVVMPSSWDSNQIGGHVPLPLSEGELKKLVLRAKWDKSTPPAKVRLAITQLNEQYEVVGGLDLLIGK